MWTRLRKLREVPRAEPAAVAQALENGTAVIFDVRSHGYYDPRSERILGSRRLDPNTLQQGSPEFPEGKLIFLYCT
jgi:rhodanese-related sulfurtransferase